MEFLNSGRDKISLVQMKCTHISFCTANIFSWVVGCFTKVMSGMEFLCSFQSVLLVWLHCVSCLLAIK